MSEPWQIDPPDGSAQASGKALGLGTLDTVGGWLAGCQGRYPPRSIARPRLAIFAADHGVAARGVSTRPAGSTGQLVAELLAGNAPLAVFAESAGLGVRVVDVGLAESVGAAHHVRAGSGAIDVEDALTSDEVDAAITAGRAIADAEVDSGADLLVVASIGVGSSTPASTLVAAITDTEPVAVIGRGSGIDDEAWMRKAAAVRDALRRARPHVSEPRALLRTVGGADIAAIAGFLAQAAARRTPVVLDGVTVTAAALIAAELAAGAAQWWLAAHRTTEPAHQLALEHLKLEPLLDLGCEGDNGAGAAAATALVMMAAQAHATAAT